MHPIGVPTVYKKDMDQMNLIGQDLSQLSLLCQDLSQLSLICQDLSQGLIWTENLSFNKAGFLCLGTQICTSFLRILTQSKKYFTFKILQRNKMNQRLTNTKHKKRCKDVSRLYSRLTVSTHNKRRADIFIKKKQKIGLKAQLFKNLSVT